MSDVEEDRNWLKILAPRILKAALWGFIMGGEILIPLYLMPDFVSQIETLMPAAGTGLPTIVAIFVAFEVAIQLFDRTIFRYALSISRTMVSMILFIIFTNGGIIEVLMPPNGFPSEAGSLQILVDFRTILAALLVFSLLSIVKNILQAVDFLSQKAEEPVIPPELP
ncbi:MAG: hypothetical protein ACETWE_02225 [Candidatus Bathyarchaeia archaeon]